MTEISDLETNMAISAYQIGLHPYSYMEVNLTIQKVSTFPKFLSRAKLYIEYEDILLAKRSNYSESYPNSWKGKKQHFKKKNFYEGKSLTSPS